MYSNVLILNQYLRPKLSSETNMSKRKSILNYVQLWATGFYLAPQEFRLRYSKAPLFMYSKVVGGPKNTSCIQDMNKDMDAFQCDSEDAPLALS